ncbi:hypothetical protein ACC699_39395, partial [Rhizobium ruizarguesonis]
VSSVMLSIPTFVIVVLLVFVFAIVLRWLPATGWVTFSDDPIGRETNMASNAISNVTAARSTRSFATDCWLNMVCPRSP